MNKNTDKGYEGIVPVLLWISFVISVIAFFAFTANRQYFINGLPINTEVHGQFGDFIGGIVGTLVALVGAFMLIATLTEQRKAFTEQRKDFRKQQVEGRILELIKLHRENIAELTLGNKKGRSVFIHIFNEFHSALEQIKDFYKQSDSNKSKIEWQHAIISIAYYITFFGINDTSRQYLNLKIKEISEGESSLSKKAIRHTLRSFVKANNGYNSEYVTPSTDPIPLFLGHQSRLGHYFRHLFQTVSYIDNLSADDFTYKEKYEYVKTLRAQLSVHEQALFLYNSISDLGLAWERDSGIVDENKKLITKYNLIKNIPNGFTSGINMYYYYPSVHYEFEYYTPEDRERLELIYNNN